MSRLNVYLRRVINHRNRKKLQNRDFSLLASNCNGCILSHDLGLQFRSPFVNLWLYPGDYLKYLKDMDHYINSDLKFISEEGIDYPVALLDDIRIYFQHYHSKEEAAEKWTERTKRINRNNLFILFTDTDGCTMEQLKEFDALPYQHKAVYTHLPYADIKSAVYIPGFEDSDAGMAFAYRNPFTGKRYYDAFDYISWFNNP